MKKPKNKTDQDSKAMMEKVEGELAEEYFQNLKEASLDINCAEGGNMQKEIWKLKKHMCPKNCDPPTAMVDKDGNLVTNQEDIKEMANKAYTERLRNRPIKQGLEDIKESKERLAEKILSIAKDNKTEPWNINDLNDVLKV